MAWSSRALRGLSLGVQLLALLMCTAGLAPYTYDLFGLGPLTVYFAMVVFVFAGYAAIIAVHEAGHVAMAAVFGWRVPVVSVMWITLWPRPFRWRWGRAAFGGMSGGIIAIPPGGPLGRAGCCGLMTGGALATLLFTGALLAASVAFAPGGAAQRLLASLAILSAASTISNVLPFSTRGGGTTDGRKLLDALRGRDIEPFGRESRLYEEVVLCRPPSAWNAELVAAVARDAAYGKSTWSGDMLLYSLALSRRELDDAKRHLARAAAKTGRTYLILIEQAFLLAYADRDAQAAARLLEGLSARRTRPMSTYWRTLGTVQVLSGQSEAAAQSFARARVLLRRMPFTTATDLEGIDRLEHLAEVPA
ncbi:MAG TPA: hypothetical protein VG387_13895 [Rhizomicrobium sp.]|jgi:hypothetical protein|nr:hypothetical protein [Rhizomicrobium sp.]